MDFNQIYAESSVISHFACLIQDNRQSQCFKAERSRYIIGVDFTTEIRALYIVKRCRELVRSWRIHQLLCISTRGNLLK